MMLLALKNLTENSGNEAFGGPEEASIAHEIGKVLRSLRKGRGLSLNDLAQLSGVSRSMLSQIETGRSIPSVLVLCKIARAFDAPVTLFLQPGNEEHPILWSAEETPLRISADGKCSWRSLMPKVHEGATEFYEITLRGRGIEESPPSTQHSRAHLAVSKGAIFVMLGSQRHRLTEGDVLEFPAGTRYTLINPDNNEALIYLVVRHRRSPA